MDFQAFKLNATEFAVKELAILAPGGSTSHFVFKAPCNWGDLPLSQRCENVWLTHNHLKIRWDDGDTPYEEIENVLRSNLSSASAVVYVKGEQKAKWLRRYIEHVVKEIDEKCPALPNLRSHWTNENSCKFHRKPYGPCALKHVILMERWLRVHRPCLERSL